MSAATIEEDAANLGAYAKAFASVCGAPIGIETLDPSDVGAGSRITFPRIFEPIELIGGINHLKRGPAILEHVRHLGFAWDSDGRVLTVPAPGAFNRRVQASGIGEPGFRACYAADPMRGTPLARWLLRCLGGEITIAVRAPAFYEALLAEEDSGRERMRWELMSVAHDLSVHALNYHLVPRSAVGDLGERIRTALSERHASWARPDAIAPLTLTYFYDNDLNRYAYAVWCRCERPADFPRIFTAPPNYEQLIAALAVRIRETKEGRGDVASGDFDEVGQLTETQFEVQ